VYGEFKDLLPNDETLHVYERSLREEQFLIILNHSDDSHPIPVSTECYNLVLQNLNNETNQLRPYEARIYKKTIK
jgi:oligo-1,6-glucosidase